MGSSETTRGETFTGVCKHYGAFNGMSGRRASSTTLRPYCSAFHERKMLFYKHGKNSEQSFPSVITVVETLHPKRREVWIALAPSLKV